MNTTELTTGATNVVEAVLIVLILAAFVAGLIALLERTHRRTAGFSRTPFGADLESDRDILRTLAELDAARAASTATSTTAPTDRARQDAQAALAAQRRRDLHTRVA